MYLRPRFLEELHAIREEMSRECDYDMDLFVQLIRNRQPHHQGSNIRGYQQALPPQVGASKEVVAPNEFTGYKKNEKAE